MTDQVVRAVRQSIQSPYEQTERQAVNYLLDASLSLRIQRITDVPYWGGPVYVRDSALRRLFYLPGLEPPQAAVSLRAQKVGTTDWILEGPKKTATYYHALLHQANFGAGFEDFQSRFVLDFDTQDNGAFVEIIGDAPPRVENGKVIVDETTGEPIPDATQPLVGPVRAIANLDALRCTRTGNPVFPVVYQDQKGRRHRLHATRVWMTADLPSNDVQRYGVGLCALSRAVSVAQRLFKWGQMADEMLDDFPSSGILAVNGMAKALFDDQMKAYEAGRQMKQAEFYHALITLFFQNKDGGVKLTPFREVWQNFDDKKFYDVMVDLTAMAWNMDRQELAPLSTSSMGSGAQSGQLSKKGRGKGVHNTLSLLERFVNLITPPSIAFYYDYTDEDQAIQEAQIRQMKTNTIVTLYTAKNPDSNVSLDTVAVQTPTLQPGGGQGGIISLNEARYWLVKEGILPREFMKDADNLYPEFQRFDDITVKARELYGEKVQVNRAGQFNRPLVYRRAPEWTPEAKYA